MAKNEIHARLPSELMKALRHICNERNCNLSDVTRAALALYVEAYDRINPFEAVKLLKSPNNLEINLIEASFLEAPQATSSLLDELTSDDIIDW
jgi:hypothetical protein